jgi:hypothetical protein
MRETRRKIADERMAGWGPLTASRKRWKLESKEERMNDYGGGPRYHC